MTPEELIQQKMREMEERFEQRFTEKMDALLGMRAANGAAGEALGQGFQRPMTTAAAPILATSPAPEARKPPTVARTKPASPAAPPAKRIKQVGIGPPVMSAEARAGLDARARAVAQIKRNKEAKVAATAAPTGRGAAALSAAAGAVLPAPPRGGSPVWQLEVSEDAVEPAPTHFSDHAADALKAILEADGGVAETAADAAEEALAKGWFVEGEGALAGRNGAVAALANAVMDCAASIPQAHLAPGAFSPQFWVRDAENGAASRGASFVGVWCQEAAIERHVLPWLMRCAVRLDGRPREGGTGQSPSKRRKGGFNGAAGKEPPNFLRALAEHLGIIVLAALAALPATQDLPPTVLCAAAAAAGAAWVALGDGEAFQSFIVDCLRSQSGAEELALAPLVAAIEAWPAAVPFKGAQGQCVMKLLRGACAAALKAERLEGRAAARHLLQLGAAEWAWGEAAAEVTEAQLAACRQQLAKLA